MKFLFLLLFSQLIQAQEVDLRQALKVGHGSNPRLKQLDAEMSAANAEKLKTLSAHLPQIAINGSHLLDNRFQFMHLSLNGSAPFDFPVLFPYSDLAITASVMVFDGLASIRRYQASSYDADAVDALRDRERLQLDEDIRIKFYQALGAKSLIEVAAENVKVLEQHLADVKVELQTGVSTKFDLLRVEVQLEDAKTDLLSAEDDVVIAERRLAQAMGIEALPGPLKGELPVVAKSALNAPALNPALRDDRRAQILRTTSAQKNSQASKGYWYPAIGIYGTQEWYDNQDRELGHDSHFRNAYEFGVRMRWNLFDGGASLAMEREAAAQAESARQRQRALDLSIPVDYDFWKRRLSHSLAVYQAAKVNVEKAQESVRLSRSGVKAGVRTNTEMIDAERDLNVARAKVVRAQVDSLESLANLELALGKPFAMPAMD
jgi:outer membrane protein TolC